MERPGPGLYDMPPPVTDVQMGDGEDQGINESVSSDKAGQAPSAEADSDVLASILGSSEYVERYNDDEGGENAVQWETSIERQQGDQERKRTPGSPYFELDMEIESGGGFGANSFAASIEGRGGGERYVGAADEREEEDILSNYALVQEAPEEQKEKIGQVQGRGGRPGGIRTPVSPDLKSYEQWVT